MAEKPGKDAVTMDGKGAIEAGDESGQQPQQQQPPQPPVSAPPASSAPAAPPSQ